VNHFVVSRHSALQKLDEARMRNNGGASDLRVHHRGAIWEGDGGLEYIRRLVQRHVAEDFVLEEDRGQKRTRISVNYLNRSQRY